MEGDLLKVARRAAAAACRRLPGGSAARKLLVEEKTSHVDLVTDADRMAEKAVIEVLREGTGPDHRILAEEAFAREGGSLEEAEAMASATKHLWIVDPLDGTTNFVHGVPFFAVSLAYLHYGEVRVALSLDPLRAERFEAIRGRGAWRNGEPIRVSEEDRLRRALVATGFPFDPHSRRRLNLERFQRVAERTRNVRVLGSAALMLAFVAAGRLSGGWDVRLSPWDMAAGWLLVEESGGRVTGLEGEAFSLFRGTIVASNGRVHDELLRAFAESSRE